MSTTATHTAHVYTATQAVDGGWAMEHREVPYYTAAEDHAVFQPGTLVSYPRQVFHALRVVLQPKDVGKVGFGDPGKLSVVLLEDNQGQAIELFRHHLRNAHRDIQIAYHNALGRFTAFEGTYPAERLSVDDHIAEANSYGGILRKHGWSSGIKKDGFWYKDYTRMTTSPAINGSPATMLTVNIGGKLHDFNYLPGNKSKDRMLHTWLEKVDRLIGEERLLSSAKMYAGLLENLQEEPPTVNWQDHPNGRPGKQARYNGYIQFRVWEHKGKHNAAVWIKFPHTDTITTSSHGTGEGFPTFGEAEGWCFDKLNGITTQSKQP